MASAASWPKHLSPRRGPSTSSIRLCSPRSASFPSCSASGGPLLLPKQEQLEKNLKAAIQSYIESDIDKVIARERAAGNTNKLGVALVRAGRYSEAKREFQKLSTVSAMNNTANILMIEKNYSAAAAQYRAVLAKDPKNKTALKGLENAKSKLE